MIKYIKEYQKHRGIGICNMYDGTQYTHIHLHTYIKSIHTSTIPKTQAVESVAKAMSMAWFTAWKRFVLRVSPNSVVVSGTNFGSARTGLAAWKSRR